MMNAQMTLEHNYRFIKADNSLIAEIVTKYMNGGIKLYGSVREEIMKGGDWISRVVLQALAWYEGDLRRDLVITDYHNLVPSVLRNSLATLISGTTVTPTFKANYLALGSGSTSPTNADTTLGTETIRGTFSNRSATLNVANLDKFFTSAQVGGNTYSEAGIFVDGTASANSGYLLSRVLINETMAATETLTVNATITVS